MRYETIGIRTLGNMIHNSKLILIIITIAAKIQGLDFFHYSSLTLYITAVGSQ